MLLGYREHPFSALRKVLVQVMRKTVSASLKPTCFHSCCFDEASVLPVPLGGPSNVTKGINVGSREANLIVGHRESCFVYQFLLYLHSSAQTLVLISHLLSTRCLLHSEWPLRTDPPMDLDVCLYSICIRPVPILRSSLLQTLPLTIINNNLPIYNFHFSH